MSKRKAMRVERKSQIASSTLRIILFAVLIALQVWWIVYMIMQLEKRYPGLSTIITLVSLIVAFGVYNRRINSAFKIPWMILIVGFPILGVCLYLFAGDSALPLTVRKKFERIELEGRERAIPNEQVMSSLRAEDAAIANQFSYITNMTGIPVFQNTDVSYHADAADGLQAMIRDLEKAEHFIFMEYHAIEYKESFADIHRILKEKASAGVEVRLFYDDIGSAGFINGKFISRMKEDGIECRVFNPVMPIFNIFMNHRDHRKITVIDGKVGYTGGYNIANEYFHLTEPYGYWKDTGIRLEGDAVAALTVIFMELWNAIEATDSADWYKHYFPKHNYHAKDTGYLLPYGGNPISREHVAEEVYMNVIRAAKHYCWFVTPYLIITDEMGRELTGAAKRGVDVRIITPGIPDKKTVYQETRSFYQDLVLGGVHIYEYTPGFCHAKMCISDDTTAIVGTINLDYRSLYHHFENAVLMYRTSVIGEIRDDFEDMFAQSEEVTDKYVENRFHPFRTFLRLISPML